MSFAIRGILTLGAWVAALVLGSAPGGVCADQGADAPSDQVAQRVVWTQKTVHFIYQGFTTHYSCEGLRDKVRKALLELGARKDLMVREGACWRPAGGPEPFPSVDVTMSVVAPLSGGSDDEQTKVVSAHWKAIDLKLDQDPLSEAGDCELLEQIKQTFLPLLTTRKVNYQSTCIPHQISPGGTWLRAEVLVADQKVPKAAATTSGTKDDR